MMYLRLMYRLIKNYRNAIRKHPKFPHKIVKSKTTYLSLRMKKNHYTRQNDEGKETVASVFYEETSELLCELFKKRWRRAEKEWLDVIVVMFRVWFMIQREKAKHEKALKARLKNRR